MVCCLLHPIFSVAPKLLKWDYLDMEFAVCWHGVREIFKTRLILTPSYVTSTSLKLWSFWMTRNVLYLWCGNRYATIFSLSFIRLPLQVNSFKNVDKAFNGLWLLFEKGEYSTQQFSFEIRIIFVDKYAKLSW